MEKTLIILKPDCMERRLCGTVLARFDNYRSSNEGDLRYCGYEIGVMKDGFDMTNMTH